jgi:hypothetical protein
MFGKGYIEGNITCPSSVYEISKHFPILWEQEDRYLRGCPSVSSDIMLFLVGFTRDKFT